MAKWLYFYAINQNVCKKMNIKIFYLIENFWVENSRIHQVRFNWYVGRLDFQLVLEILDFMGKGYLFFKYPNKFTKQQNYEFIK